MPLLMIFLLCYGVLLGTSMPSQTTSLVNTFVHEKGTAMGVYNFVRFTGAAIGPLLGSALFKIGGNDALYFTLFLFLVGVGVVIQWTNRASLDNF